MDYPFIDMIALRLSGYVSFADLSPAAAADPIPLHGSDRRGACLADD